ncbi:MAG TPA: hypothetical protein DEG17_20015 [Cyanobacteria bacterium UBA11149]|nr:hypothetical protein [Cyanobacteria bacterium UBA11367]HBE58991.1 hypothetical protein [Cyanobacteria bacterium UBA11366]HBK66011.1 hypothetical protein [Cyanobacteria bacterium UBA11166]HBR76922.1 hypothetical protein [Cyanobacteria bacterium UBA11159]HBS68311.1 hypothetical protein [Cyanobacteria bacterium UBA11153]HBW91084.1 hypothetical protein [Cyanobacteria bacterium UBA11149]HCA94737.1 hypothetical protein [Cyanobacteria bacterium UBA9226]
MDELKNTSCESTIIENKATKPGLLLQAVVFTAILAFCVDNRSPNPKEAISSTETPLEVVSNVRLQKGVENQQSTTNNQQPITNDQQPTANDQ